ncbi:MAG: hypothetical protein KGN01_07830 [Patescibacteria group bacterium]|nr:hypothetical protein [Patescibacteria group bacterium]
MKNITFDCEFLHKGGTSEPKCQKIVLISQELPDNIASVLPLLHKNLVRVTITYED